MVDDPQSQAARALASVGTTPDTVARAVADVAVEETSDAPTGAIVEVRVAGRTLRVADAALVAKLSAASTEEVLGALRRVAAEAAAPDEPSEVDPPRA